MDLQRLAYNKSKGTQSAANFHKYPEAQNMRNNAFRDESSDGNIEAKALREFSNSVQTPSDVCVLKSDSSNHDYRIKPILQTSKEEVRIIQKGLK